MIVTDNSGSAALALLRRGEELMVADGAADPRFCFVAGTNTVATVRNTEKITVFAAPAQVAGGYRIDQNNGRFAPEATPENDGDSEIEITLVTTGVAPPQMTVAGTPQRDVMSVGTGGPINFSYDNDADVIPQTKPEKVVVTGGVGNDAGNDSVVATGNDNILRGGSDSDSLFSANGIRDGLTGGPGFDSATIDEKIENIPFGDIEQIRFLEQVGRLKLAPAVVDARAGQPARLKLSWAHPKAWKQLRTIKLRLSQGAEVLGTISVRPVRGTIRGKGAVDVVARASKLTHRGKTVTARLAVRLNRSLAGQDLRVDVEAVDRKGHKQREPLAGVVHVNN